MDLEHYFQSLTDECSALKDRVRHLISDKHWPTDGEWKESVLRSMLKRTAPKSVTVGRGFVVHKGECSTQIDVLIYDNSMPILYRDGDLVFVTPYACRGIVEVKSQTSLGSFRTVAEKLANNAEFIRSHNLDFGMFVGFFSYDLSSNNCQEFLRVLNETAKEKHVRIIDHVVLGESTLIRYWSSYPKEYQDEPNYNHWHLHNLNRMAPGYFIHNLLLSASKNVMAQREDAIFSKNSIDINTVDRHEFRCG